MKFNEALAALKSLDNGVELVSAIEAEVQELKDKNYTVIGEKRQASSKVQAYEQALSAIARSLNLDPEDLESVLSGAEDKIRSISTSLAQAQADKASFEARSTEAEAKVAAAERQVKITAIATAAAANPKALEKLLGDRLAEIVIDGDRVLLGTTPLREFVEADEGLKDFAPALFPAAPPQEKPAPKLPGGAPGGATKEEPPARSYISSVYGKTADFMLGKSPES